MCGLLGAWWSKDQNNVEKRVSESLELLRHRGPNDSGMEVFSNNTSRFALAHTRLSVIDLSAGGHQPMFSNDARYALLFNGEIYNYKEIQKELEQLGVQFSTHSDTEVLLKAWIQWEEKALSRFKGMFAFAVFDKIKSTLTCVRDAFGIKPLFYSYEEAKSFAFASELPALLKLRGKKPELNWQKSYDYLVYGEYDNEEDTFIDGIQHLLPGHLLEFHLESGKLLRKQQWWNPKIEESCSLGFDEAAEKLRNLFLDNVKLHLRSDVPLGAALSGGIDSSAVVCAMRHLEPDLPLHTFSYIAKGSERSEETWVDLVCQRTHAISHKVVANADELARDLETMLRAQGEPFGSTSIYAQYRVFQLAKEKGMTVTLEGQGADELMAGYNGHPGYRLYTLLSKGKIPSALAFAKAWGQGPGRKSRHAWTQFASLLLPNSIYQIARKSYAQKNNDSWINFSPLKEANIRIAPLPLRIEDSDRALITKLAYSLQVRDLPALLRHGDRNSMHFSIEGRVPLLTTDMADFLYSLPESYLLSSGGQTKHIFRAAMRGIVPDEVLNRKDKIGFETPEKEWLLSISDTLRSWLLEETKVPFLNEKELLRHFEAIIAGNSAFTWQLWRWVNFYRWHKAFITSS